MWLGSFASAHRLLCDLKFFSSTSTHGIFFGLKLCLRTRNILRLKVPQFRFRIQNSVWLGALKWRNSAPAQGKYCGLEVTQFRFHTINSVRLEVSQFLFHTRALTLSPAVPPPYKEYSVTWSFALYFALNFLSSASARKGVIWNSTLLLLHENITFLWKIHSHSTIHPFLNFCAVLHEWWTRWRHRNKGIGMLLAKVVVNVWLREALVDDTLCSYWHSSRLSDRENEAVLLCWHTYVNAFGWRQYLPDVMDYLPIRSITVCGKSDYLISA